MTVVAAHVIPSVPPGFPERKVSIAGVTAHAGLRLSQCRDRAFAETHRVGIFRRRLCVSRIFSVARGTGFAASRRRAGIALNPVLGLHDARLVLVTGEASLRIRLRKRRLISSDGKKEDNWINCQ
jgi:hypothetical protein